MNRELSGRARKAISDLRALKEDTECLSRDAHAIRKNCETLKRPIVIPASGFDPKSEKKRLAEQEKLYKQLQKIEEQMRNIGDFNKKPDITVLFSNKKDKYTNKGRAYASEERKRIRNILKTGRSNVKHKQNH